MMSRRALLGLTVFGGSMVFPLPARAQVDNDPVLIKANKLAEGYNKVAEYIKYHSPYSLDYKDQVRQKWYNNDVSRKFKELEKEILRG